MDSTETWMHIILEWANHTGFLFRKFYSLHKTDIVSFFAKFRQRISTVEINQSNLLEFLKVYYPDFKLDLDLNGELLTDSYVYIYSLMLHFACVLYPQADMHHMCKGLNEKSQVRIAAFFTALMQRSSIDRNVLEAAIAESIAASDKPELMSPFKSFSSSGGSIGDGNMTFSPPTPRTKMMDYWNIENKQLKASLETERFERGILEDQLKQLEDKITDLQADRKRQVNHTNELKNKLLAKNTENESPNSNTQDEQIKQRLRKQIASKEDEIVQLTTTIDAMRDENLSLRDKYKICEQKNRNLSEQVQDYIETISTIQIDLDFKDQNLQQLQKSNHDLEQLIRDSRILYKAENPLDISVECLDVSRLSDASKSAGSLELSPETLGHTVIDMQLREQKSQNEQFSVKLANAEAANARLVNSVNEIMQKHSIELNILHENIAEQQAKEVEQKRQIEDYLKDLESQRNINSQQHNDHQQAIHLIEAKCEILINENKMMLDNCEQLNKNLVDECARHDLFKTEFERNHELVKTLRSDLNEEKDKCDNLTKSIEETRQMLMESDERYVKTERLQVESQNKISDINAKLHDAENLIAKTILDSNNQLAEKNNAIATQEEIVEKLSKEITVVCNEIIAKDTIIDVLKEKIHAAESQAIECQSKLSVSGKEVADVQTKLLEAERLLGKTKLDYDHKIIENDKCLQRERDTLIREHSIEMAAHEEKLQNLLTENSRNLNVVSENNLQIDQLKLRLNAEEAKIVECASKLDIANNEIERLNSELFTTTERLNELTNVSSTLDQCQIKLVEKSEWITKITQRLMDSDSIIQAKDKEISELHRCQLEFEEAINFKESSIKEIAVFQQQIDKILSEKLELEARLAALTANEADIKEQLTAVRLTNTNLSNEREKFVHEFELERAEQQVILQRLQAECQSLTLTGANTKQLLGAMNDKIRDLEEKERKACDEKIEITNKLTSLLERTVILKQEKSKLENDISAELQHKQRAEELQRRVLEMELLQTKHVTITDDLNRTQQILNGLNVFLCDELQKLNFVFNTNELSGKTLAESISEQVKSLHTLKNEALLEQQKKINDLNDRINVVNDENAKLKSSLDSITTTVNKLTEDNLTLNSVAEKYGEQSVQLEEVRSQVQKLKLENEMEQQNHQDEVKAITEQLKGNCDIPEHSTKIKELQTKYEDIEKFDKLLDEMASECAGLMRVIEIEKQKQAALNDALATLNSDLAAEKSFNSSLKNAVEVHQQRVEEAEIKCTEFERLLKASEFELTDIKSKLHDAEQIKVSVLDNENKSRTKFDKLVGEHSKELTIVEEKLKILEKEQTKVCQENIQKNLIVDKLHEKLKVAEKLNLELKSKLMQSTEEVIELNLKLSAHIELQKEYEKTTTELGECSGRLLETTSALQFSKDTALAEAALSRTEIEKLQQNIDSVRKTIQENDDELATLRDLKSEHEKVLHVKEIQTKDITNFQEQLTQILLDKSELQVQVSQLTASVSDVNDQLNSARSDNTKLTIERQELSQQIEFACTQLKSVQLDSSEKLKSLQAECESLTQTCAVLKHKTDELTNSNRELQAKDNASCAEKALASEKMAAFMERIHALEKEKEELDRDVSVAMKHRTRVEELQLHFDEMALVQTDHTRLQQDYAEMRLCLFELSQSLYEQLKKQPIVKYESEADFEENPVKCVVQNIDRLQSIKEHEIREYKNEISVMKQQLEALGSVQNDNIQLNESCSAVTASLKKITNDYIELKKSQANEIVEMRLQIERLEHEHEQVFNKNNKRSDELKNEYESVQLAADQWKEKYEAVVLAERENRQSVQILNAKLMKHRTLKDQETEEWETERDQLRNDVKLAESRVTETRLELEGKLEKMKSKMKVLYTDEVKKIKEKHEHEMNTQHQIYEEERSKLKSENHELEINLRNYKVHNSKLAGQIFQLNESTLDLKTKNEFFKNKLRMLENNQPIPRSRMPQSSSMNSLIKMEDEEGQLFNEQFLEEMKLGTYRSTSPSRDSLSVKEMQYRNSLLLPHMRSTYLPQCGNQQFSEEEIKMLRPPESHNNESIVSVQSTGEVRRGRLYQKPGPPTPSKNGARLSLGATTSAELNSFRDTLKENISANPNKGNQSRTPKGKMSSLFSSKKKDENSSPKRRLSMNIFKKNSNR